MNSVDIINIGNTMCCIKANPDSIVASIEDRIYYAEQKVVIQRLKDAIDEKHGLELYCFIGESILSVKVQHPSFDSVDTYELKLVTDSDTVTLLEHELFPSSTECRVEYLFPKHINPVLKLHPESTMEIKYVNEELLRCIQTDCSTYNLAHHVTDYYHVNKYWFNKPNINDNDSLVFNCSIECVSDKIVVMPYKEVHTVVTRKAPRNAIGLIYITPDLIDLRLNYTVEKNTWVASVPLPDGEYKTKNGIVKVKGRKLYI